MVTIKDGYNNKELSLIFEKVDKESLRAYLWVKFEQEHRQDTLNYVSLDELIKLRNEINEAIKQMVGVE
jgi:hypothetical protein